MSAADVRLAMHGDHDAFAALVTAATTRLYALACLIIRDPDRAADATQEAFIHAWREIPRLRDADHFDASLRRLVVNASYDEARRGHRRNGGGRRPVPDRRAGSHQFLQGECARAIGVLNP